VVALSDRLDFVIGRTTAKKLDNYFGLRTVNDLIRYYPRKYNEGMTVRGEGEDLDLEEANMSRS
jgi:ATP-dependent DNA helicase RecG